jgi:hypothetical protein
MPPRRRASKDTPAKLAKRISRRWRVVLLRAKGEILGSVEAPDADAAKAAAAVQFELDEIQRDRIMMQELA